MKSIAPLLKTTAVGGIVFLSSLVLLDVKSGSTTDYMKSLGRGLAEVITDTTRLNK